MDTSGVTASRGTQTESNSIECGVRSVIGSIAGISALVGVGVLSRSASAIFRRWRCGPSCHVGVECRGAVSHSWCSPAVIRVTGVVVVGELHSGLDLSDVSQPSSVPGFGTCGVEGNQNHRS